MRKIKKTSSDLLLLLKAATKLLLKGYIKKQKFPLSICLTLTRRCNQQCQYCDFIEEETIEMSTTEWRQIIDEFIDNGTLRFGFAGGEPLLREDAGELLS